MISVKQGTLNQLKLYSRKTYWPAESSVNALYCAHTLDFSLMREV